MKGDIFVVLSYKTWLVFPLSKDSCVIIYHIKTLSDGNVIN